MSRILVTDGEQRSALAIVRSLGGAGHRVFVISTRTRSLAGGSRHCAGEYSVPDPLRDADGYVEALADVAEMCGVDVIVPVTEASIHAILPVRSRFGGTLIPFPDYAAFRAVSDKALLMDKARDMGIAVPRQRTVENQEQVPSLEVDLRFPAVVKPSRSVVPSARGRRKTSVVHVRNHVELRGALEALPREAFPALVQERVTGPGTGVFLLLWEGELLAAFCQIGRAHV
mgnify:CR=1 FL=1